MPKVSVIVPNYNHHRYLQKRLESVFNQTFQDFDVLLMDDASTDDSLDTLKKYAKGSRNKLLVNPQNSGSPFKQWNKGFNNVTGDYIWLAESDDYADPIFLERLVSALDDHPSAGIAYCQSWIVEPGFEDKPRCKVDSWYAAFENRHRWKRDFENIGTDEITKYLVYRNTIPNASAVLFRRSVLVDGLAAPEDLRLVGDWMFWVKILLNHDLVYRCAPLNYFRSAHSASQRSRTARHALELLEGLDVYSFIAKNVPLDSATKAGVLRHQVRLWGSLGFSRRLTWSTHVAIFEKLISVHPEVRNRKTRAVVLPFLYHFVKEPFRNIPVLANFYRGLKSALAKND